jgi:hypothetical protein
VLAVRGSESASSVFVLCILVLMRAAQDLRCACSVKHPAKEFIPVLNLILDRLIRNVDHKGNCRSLWVMSVSVPFTT